ncbi:MAG: protein RhiA [Bacteroidota bacterium]
MLILNFATTNNQVYSLNCTNNSSSNWVFFTFQRMDGQNAQNIFSTAWFVSPYKLTPNSHVKFKWSENYSFYWYGPGKLVPGAVFQMWGSEAAALETANATTFDFEENTPAFSKATAGSNNEQFIIDIGADVPNQTFSTGIGMSNQMTFVQQSLVNTTQQFNPQPEYWIAAASEMMASQVLGQNSLSNSSSFDFPANVYERNAVFNSNNTWTIT